MTTILNFGHPLSSRVLSHLAAEDPATGEMVPARQVRVSLQLDLDTEPTPPQVARAVDTAFKVLRDSGIAVDGTVPIAVVLPGLTEATALLLAELHGRLGSFPRVLALRRVGDGTYGLFADSADLGVLDLERLRQEARERR